MIFLILDRFWELFWRPRDLKTLHSVQYIPQNPENRTMQLRTLKKTVPDPILEGFSLQVGLPNRAKIDIKGCWKNDENMMMTKMATKSDLDDHEWKRILGFGARGGVPLYCTGDTPPPPRRLIVGAPIATKSVFKVKSSIFRILKDVSHGMLVFHHSKGRFQCLVRFIVLFFFRV